MLIVGLITVWGTDWGIDLFVPGAALISVALTAYIAAGGVVSWREQRQRDREAAEYRHREESYEEMAGVVVRSISGHGSDLAVELKYRISAALWGSAETVSALKGYQESVHWILANHGLQGSGSVSMTEPEQIAARAAVGEVLAAMRKDLASTTGQKEVDRETLLASIFNG